MTNAPGVYAIVNGSTERTYIGSTTCLRNRWREHRSALRTGRHRNAALQRDWNEYGERLFVFVPLEVVDDAKQRIVREQVHINAAHHAYNVSTKAGSGPKPGTKPSPEAVEKMRAALLGKPKSAEHRARLSQAKRGTKCPAQSLALKGRTLSPETKEKMRLAHLGLKMSPESSERKRLALTGRIVRPETGRRISAAKKGKPNPKQAERLRGNPLSLETRQRMSGAHTGTKWSESRRVSFNIKKGVSPLEATR